MSDEEVVKRWSVGPFQCSIWRVGDDTILHGGVARAGVPVGTVDVLSEFGENRTEAVVTAIAVELRRPEGVWNLDPEPITDVVMAACPRDLNRDQVEHLDRQIVLATGLVVTPVGPDLRDALYLACDPPGIGRGLSIDLRGHPLYAFMRLDAPREQLYGWDPDNRLQMCLALSRLVRPTSVSFRYAARIIGRVGAERVMVRPGPVREFGAEAWTSSPERDWLSMADFSELRTMLAAFDSQPFDPRSRVGGAFWLFEYASRTRMVDMRVPLVSTALETLLGTGGDRTTRQFIQRLPQLAAKCNLPTISNAEARRMWGLRSGLVHGERRGGLKTEDFERYTRMETVLRVTLKQALKDLVFRAQFENGAAIESAFPLV